MENRFGNLMEVNGREQDKIQRMGVKESFLVASIDDFVPL
jgi:hypothetical protein